MNTHVGFKVGDTYPFVFRIAVTDDGVDVTEDVDFSTWQVECQYKRPDGSVAYDVANPFLSPGSPVLDCSLPSSVSSTLTPGIEYKVDVRIKDDQDFVRSTATRRFKLEAAVSETP